jgi:hypothetical protein
MGAAYAKCVSLTSGSGAPRELHYYTFRIRSIDKSINEQQLETCLTQPSPSIGNVLAVSLVPDNGHKTGTVTFEHVPPEFVSVNSGNKNSESFIANRGNQTATETDLFLNLTRSLIRDPANRIIPGII